MELCLKLPLIPARVVLRARARTFLELSWTHCTLEVDRAVTKQACRAISGQVLEGSFVSTFMSRGTVNSRPELCIGLGNCLASPT